MSWQKHQSEVLDIKENEDLDLFGHLEQVRVLHGQIERMFREQPDRCVIVSVTGPFGSGKSTFIGALRGRVLSAAGAGGLLTVDWNPWKNASKAETPWVGIADAIGEVLYRSLGDREHGEVVEPVASPPSSRGHILARQRDPSRVSVLKVSFAPEPLVLEIEVKVADMRQSWREVARRISDKVGSSPGGAELWSPSFALFTEPHSHLVAPRPSLSELLIKALPSADAQADWWSNLLKVLAPLVGGGLGLWSEGVVGALTGVLTGAVLVLPYGVKNAWNYYNSSRQVSAELPRHESAHFVELLNGLLHHLGPARISGSPRLIVVVEDIGRVEKSQRDAVLRALAYLEQLQGALVLLAMDEHDLIQEQQEVVANPRAGDLARVLHIRERVPLARQYQLRKLVSALAEELGLKNDRRSIRITARLWQAGFRSPRAFKRRLVWIEQRYPRLACGETEEQQPAGLEFEGLAILSTLVEPPERLEEPSDSWTRSLLLRWLALRRKDPLTGGDWFVSFDVEGVPTELSSNEKWNLLIGWLRLCELALFLLGRVPERWTADIGRAWRDLRPILDYMVWGEELGRDTAIDSVVAKIIQSTEWSSRVNYDFAVALAEKAMDVQAYDPRLTEVKRWEDAIREWPFLPESAKEDIPQWGEMLRRLT